MITGSVYLLRGRPVTVLAAWNGARRDLPAPLPLVRLKATCPRNVLIRRPDGREEVRGHPVQVCSALAFRRPGAESAERAFAARTGAAR